MKSLTTYITEKMVYTKVTASKIKYFPESTEELRSIISNKIKKEGPNANLNDIDVSHITDMSNLFSPDFCGDVSEWDVSNVTNMKAMFDGCEKFNGDLSKWNVSKVEDMSLMFRFCREFEGKGLDKWNTDNLKTCFKTFNGCKKFDVNLSNWNMENATTTEEMFAWCIIYTGKGIEDWNVSKVEDAEWMFYKCKELDVNLSKWKFSNINSMVSMDDVVIQSGIYKKAEYYPKL